MKKLVISFILVTAALFTFASCDVGEDTNSDYNFKLVAIDSVDVPDHFILGETKPLKLYYKRPSTCHFFNGFYYEKNLNTRTVAIQMAVFNASNCEPLEEELAEASLDFYVSNSGTYIFKFFTGVDAAGQNTFLEYEIPVLPE